jgi:hypothetical protein
MSAFIYLCLPLYASVGSTSIFLSLLLPLSNVYLFSFLFAYVWTLFVFALLVYLLLSPKLCELLSSNICLFSKSFSFPIHYHVVMYYLVTNVYLGPL